VKKINKGLVSCFIVISIILFLVMPANAANFDTGAIGVGYYVDLDAYKPVLWYNRVTTNVYYSGTLVGTSQIDIGVCRAKSTSGGYYIDSVLTRTSMKGKGSNSKYGYSDFLRIAAPLNPGQILWAHSPKAVASSTSYTIGMNLGGSVDGGKPGFSGGISASHTFTKNALSISDLSDPSSRLFNLKFSYGHAFWRWDWDTLDSYAYNYSEQLACYEIKTTSSRYSCKLVQDVKFKIYNAVPGYWANPTGGTSEVICTINFTSAY